MRILHSDNIMIRRYGLTKVSTGRKLFYGMIRNNWVVYEYSERDIAKFEAPFGIKPLGIKSANRRFIETCENFKPEIILIGHSDLITNKTLSEIKSRQPNVKIIYRNVDPLWRKRNIEMIKHRMDVVDSIFVTTAGDPLKQFKTKKNIVSYIPNATDPSVETYNNSTKAEFERDLVYCGKGEKSDDRYSLIVELHKELNPEVCFETYGIHGHEAVFGERYDHVLRTSKMALNLNRYEGWPWYSSARISQLLGNGILTFTWDKGDMRHFFTDDTIVFFSSFEELVEKVRYFNQNDHERQKIAAQGRQFYHEHFSGERIVKYMVEVTLNLKHSHDYLWKDAVIR